jgi:hypothetical protein
MTIVLVLDTSVLVDLERGGFLDSCFQLPFGRDWRAGTGRTRLTD